MAINTAAILTHDLISGAALRFGASSIVVAIEGIRRIRNQTPMNVDYACAISAGTEFHLQTDPIAAESSKESQTASSCTWSILSVAKTSRKLTNLTMTL